MEVTKSCCMKKNRLFCLFILLVLVGGVSAQLVEKVREFLAEEDTMKTVPVIRTDSDSLNIAKMREELEAARLNEANMRMEMEQMKLRAYAADSVKLALQRLRIDSLRKFTPGVPVVVEGDTLFYIFAKRGGHTPQQRAEMNAAAITELGKRFNLQPDSLYLEIENPYAQLPQPVLFFHLFQFVHYYLTFIGSELVACTPFPQTILIGK